MSSIITGTVTIITDEAAAQVINPCDDRCMFAKGDDCDCECEGKNHQRGHLMTPAQRTILRTKAGRRIPVITVGSADWNRAQQMAHMEAHGTTRKDIAATMGVSAPVVRRTLRSLTHTMDLMAAVAN